MSQEGLRTINSHRETNTRLSHTFPGITLLSWWGLSTQQLGAPPMTRHSPSGHTKGPDPSSLRTEHPLLSPDLSPQEWEDSQSWYSVRNPDWNELGHLKHSRAVHQHKLPERESLVRGYKTCVCKMPHQWNVKPGLSITQRRKAPPNSPFLSQPHSGVTNKNAINVLCTKWICDRFIHRIIITVE